MLGVLGRTWHPDPLNPQMKPPVKLWLFRPWKAMNIVGVALPLS